MTTATLPSLYPDNDFAMRGKLKELNLTTAEVEALLSGTVTAFFAATKGGAQVGALTTTLTHVEDDTWLLVFDATLLTDVVLQAAFAATALAYLCVVYANGFRVWYTIPYLRYRDGVVG